MKRKSKDLKEVLRQEQGRSKRYVPSEEEKEAYKKSLKPYKDMLRAMNWSEVVTALSLRQGTLEYDEYHRIWKDYRRDCDEFY
jgi:hypothetical protein